jgi:hypothetical protein
MNSIPEKQIPTIPVGEWEKIVRESDSANKILNNDDFSFLRDYLRKAKDSAILLVATNQIHDVLETYGGGGGGNNNYSKTIKTTKEEQLNEIAGCIKFIDKLFADLETLSKQESEYLKLAEENKVIIEVTKEDANSK